MARKQTKVKQVLEVSTTWQDALQGFLFWKQAQGKSPITINDYKQHIQRFFNRYPDSWQSPQLKLHLMEYLSDNIKPVTYNLRLIYLRTFLNWCIDENYITENPLKGFKKRKAQSRIVDVPEDTLKALLTLPDQTTFAGLRDYALILFTLDTGIRPKEALSLTVGDFDLKHLIVTVPADQAKTRVSRTLPILPPTAEVIGRLIRVRYPEWDRDVPVFCSCEGTQLSRHTWGDRMEFYSKQLGIKIRPYDLRHLFSLMYLR